MPTTRRKKRAALKRALVSTQALAHSGDLSTLKTADWNRITAFLRHHAGKLLCEVGRRYPQNPDPDSHDDRDDLVGDAVVKLLDKKTTRFDPSRRPANPAAYLYGLLRNAFTLFAGRHLGLRYDRHQKTWLRTRHDYGDPLNEETGRPRSEQDIPDDSSPVDTAYVKKEELAVLWIAQARLDLPAKQLIHEAFFLGRPRQEIAKDRHVSRSTVSRESAGHLQQLGAIMLTIRT